MDADYPQFASEVSVLVVDDDEQMCAVLHRALSRAGYRCRTATSAKAARTSLEEHRFELVICDIHMPQESGLDLISSLRQQEPTLAVVMVSGDDSPTVALIAADRGAYGYLVKPFTTNELLITVSNGLHRRRLKIQAATYEHRLEQTVEKRTRELGAALESLRRSHSESVRRLSKAVEIRDSNTGGHIDRIGLVAGLLGTEIGMEPDQVEMLRLAAPMHDVGKIGIRDDILLKPGALTLEERQEMERHTTIGYDLLSGSDSPLLQMAAEVALTHHERYDGKGYPRQLVGEDIPLEGRVVAVADVFDALISDRVYRPAMSVEDAVDLMLEGRGTQFDARVLDALLANLDRVVKLRFEHDQAKHAHFPNELARKYSQIGD